MRRWWRLFTPRGRVFLGVGIAIVLVAMATGQRDVMRVGLLLAILPAVAAILVARASLRLSCERSVQPARVHLGAPMTGRLVLGQDARLPAGILLLQDTVPAQLGNEPRFCVDKADLSWRRVVEYPMLGRVRGRFVTGPLRVRTADPFGLVQLDRQFVATSEVLVTPEVVPLTAVRTAGGGGSTGETKPHRVGVIGQDDALVREYRDGDDVRRIHWRSTARRGELMVRREEQAWDPTVSLILDSRSSAHAGPGIWNSLEWAISAVASIGVHFLDDGFGIEVYEADGPLDVGLSQGQRGSMAHDALLGRLTDLRPRATRSLRIAVESAAVDRPGQLVVAVLGRLTAEDAHVLLRARRNRAQGVALLLDVDTFAEGPVDPVRRAQHELAARTLRENQWRVLDVPRGMGVGAAWLALEQLNTGP